MRQQILAHRAHHRPQQLAHSQHPAVQRGTADLEARFTLQHRRLPVQRQMVAVFLQPQFQSPRDRWPAFVHDARRLLRHRYVPCRQQRQARFSRLVTRTK